jgi:hypothetical protein
MSKEYVLRAILNKVKVMTPEEQDAFDKRLAEHVNIDTAKMLEIAKKRIEEWDNNLGKLYDAA